METEAYLGKLDDAAHSYKGRTDRARAVCERGRSVHIPHLRMYYCLNVSSGPAGEPECVLIRALEPVEGIDLMAHRRGKEKLRDLCSGPGKLCQALQIDKSLTGWTSPKKGRFTLYRARRRRKLRPRRASA